MKKLSDELASVKTRLVDAENEKKTTALEHQAETEQLKIALIRMEKEINSLSPTVEVKQVKDSTAIVG